jgi:hypothetical protein
LQSQWLTADGAGVGQTKARMALKEAARLGLLTVEERRIPCRPNLPNVVRIVSREWLAWITRAGRGGRKGLEAPSDRVHKEKAHGQQGFARRLENRRGYGMTKEGASNG